MQLVDGEHDHPPVGRRLVGREDRVERIGTLPARRLHVDLDELRRDDAPLGPVDLDHEIGREQILDRTAAVVGDRHVNRNDVDAGAEGRSLLLGLRLLAFCAC